MSILIEGLEMPNGYAPRCIFIHNNGIVTTPSGIPIPGVMALEFSDELAMRIKNIEVDTRLKDAERRKVEAETEKIKAETARLNAKSGGHTC